MAKRKNSHAHVGDLTDAKKAIRREEERVWKQKQRAEQQRLGLERTESDATKALKLLRNRSQRHYVVTGSGCLCSVGPPQRRS
jgi:hypothetical protein